MWLCELHNMNGNLLRMPEEPLEVFPGKVEEEVVRYGTEARLVELQRL